MNARIKPLMVELLRRVVELGRADGYQFGEVARLSRRAGYLAAHEALLDCGLVERVIVRCGVWFYRLTEAGRAAIAAGAIPRRPRVPQRDSTVDPVPVYPTGGRRWTRAEAGDALENQ